MRGPAIAAAALAFTLAILALASAGGQAAPTWPSTLHDSTVAEGFTLPSDFAFLPDGSLIVLEQAGFIKFARGGEVRTLVDMTASVKLSFEQGLLGVAVDPGYPERPYLFVHYDALETPGHIHLSRFTVENASGPGPPTINRASEVIYIGDIRDETEAHNGGTVKFGPDGMLYMSVGDDWDSCRAQNLELLTGKILRINVGPGANPADRWSLVPPDNPFADAPHVNTRLIFAYGLRNPFRFDFDKDTGLLIIGDVGEDRWEEISVSRGGENFGWPYMEANHVYTTKICFGHTERPTDFVAPVYEYPQPWAAAIILPTVYHGVDYPNDSSWPPEFNGVALFADFFSEELQGLKFDEIEGTWNLVHGLNASVIARGLQWFTSSHVGPDGAFYYLHANKGELHRVAYGQPSLLHPSTTFRAPVGQVVAVQLVDEAELSGLAVLAPAGPVPPGMQLTRAGRLEGTPTQMGEYHFTVRVVDALNPLRSQVVSYTMRVGCQGFGCFSGEMAPEMVFSMLLLAAPAAIFVPLLRGKGERASHEGTAPPQAPGGHDER